MIDLEFYKEYNVYYSQYQYFSLTVSCINTVNIMIVFNHHLYVQVNKQVVKQNNTKKLSKSSYYTMYIVHQIMHRARFFFRRWEARRGIRGCWLYKHLRIYINKIFEISGKHYENDTSLKKKADIFKMTKT